MMGRTHLAVAAGATAAAVTFANLPIEHPGALAVAIMLIGALAPDIDNAGLITKPGNLLAIVDKITNALKWVLNGIMGWISWVLKKFAGHRTWTHDVLWFAVICGLGYYLRWPPLVMWFGIGYGLHILADLFTKQGVPLGWPINHHRIHLANIKTGGSMETLIYWLALGVVGYCLFYQFRIVLGR